MPSSITLLRGGQSLALQDGCVATIGNFDGVHIGHQAILERVCQEKIRRKLPSLVFVFEPQPSEYFQTDQAPARLYGLREKIQCLKELGVDYVVCLKFNQYLSAMSPEVFARFIVTNFHVRCLIVGDDFRFGHHRAGNGQLLTSIGQSLQCEVSLLSQFLHHQVRVSSTQIRQLLKSGQLSQVKQLLGRAYHMCARVVPGRGLGRTLGIPTANLNIKRRVLPLSGVFVVMVQCQDGDMRYGIANLGCRPTLGGGQTVLEVHLFDFEQMIYGEWLKVSFLCKLRDETKFASVEHLVSQIKQDIQKAQYILQTT